MFINQTILIITLTAISGLLFLWNIWQQFSLRKIKQKQAILFQGKEAKDLEKIILEQQNGLINLSKQSKRLFEITDALTTASNIGLSKVGMVRFNPFKNLGGNQSFAVAFLNNHFNGLVISSIYSGEGSRFYAKTILEGKSLVQYPLAKEEQEAIDIAMGKK
jgi:hypothetical protein